MEAVRFLGIVVDPLCTKRLWDTVMVDSILFKMNVRFQTGISENSVTVRVICVVYLQVCTMLSLVIALECLAPLRVQAIALLFLLLQRSLVIPPSRLIIDEGKLGIKIHLSQTLVPLITSRQLLQIRDRVQILFKALIKQLVLVFSRISL